MPIHPFYQSIDQIQAKRRNPFDLSTMPKDPSMDLGLGADTQMQPEVNNPMQPPPPPEFGLGANTSMQPPPMQTPMAAPEPLSERDRLYNHLQSTFPDRIKAAQDSLQKNKVTPEELEQNRKMDLLNSLSGAFSQGAAAAGNIGGKQATSTVPEFAKQMGDINRQQLEGKQKAYAGAQASLEGIGKQFEEVEKGRDEGAARKMALQDKQADFANQQTMRDPQSNASNALRKMAARLDPGADPSLLDGMSGEQIMKIYPVLEKVGTSTAERQFKAEQNALERQSRKADIMMKMQAASQQKGMNSQKMETDLRKEIAGDATVKAYHLVDEAVRKVKESSNVPENSPARPAADVALLYAYMKLLDPTSAVKEGEVAMAKDTQNIPDRIRNMYNSARTGEKLSPSIRAGMLQHSNNLFKTHEEKFKEAESFYKGVADQYGLDMKYLMQPVTSKDKTQVAGKIPSGSGIDTSTLPIATF